jgi:hypothetical protein
VDEFLAELEARMASATRASGVHPPLTAEALQVIAATESGRDVDVYLGQSGAHREGKWRYVSSDMTPNGIIAELRQRQRPRS